MDRPIFKLKEALLKNRLISYAEVWREVAGPAIIKISEFRGCVEVQGHLTLCLLVKDPVWRQEIFHQRLELLKQYQKHLIKRGMETPDLPTHIHIRAT